MFYGLLALNIINKYQTQVVQFENEATLSWVVLSNIYG